MNDDRRDRGPALKPDGRSGVAAGNVRAVAQAGRQLPLKSKPNN